MLVTSPPSEAISRTVRPGKEGVLLAGDQRHDLDIRGQAVVGQRHAELVLEVGEDPQAAHDHLGLHLAAEVDGQPADSR